MPSIEISSNRSDDAFSFLSHSGKAIPNGTDKNQLGTPENEGKFQKCPVFQLLLGCMSPPAGYFVKQHYFFIFIYLHRHSFNHL